MSIQDEQAHLAEMEALYGTECKYSDYKRGDTITYRSIDTGQLKTDTIEWVADAGRILSGKTVPARYILGFDVVYLSEVIEGRSEESTLVKCPYCPGMHPKAMTDLCPHNPHRQRS